MGERERREGLFDLSDETIAAMERDGWELVAVVPHIGRQHPGQTEFVFEREVDASKRRAQRQMDLYRGDDHP